MVAILILPPDEDVDNPPLDIISIPPSLVVSLIFPIPARFVERLDFTRISPSRVCNVILSLFVGVNVEKSSLLSTRNSGPDGPGVLFAGSPFIMKLTPRESNCILLSDV